MRTSAVRVRQVAIRGKKDENGRADVYKEQRKLVANKRGNKQYSLWINANAQDFAHKAPYIGGVDRVQAQSCGAYLLRAWRKGVGLTAYSAHDTIRYLLSFKATGRPPLTPGRVFVDR